MNDRLDKTSLDEAIADTFGKKYDPSTRKASARLDLGRLHEIDPYPHHRAVLEISLDLSKPGQVQFTTLGEILNLRSRGQNAIESSGQIRTQLLNRVKDSRWSRIEDLWRRHHLNAMRAECTHMRQLGWRAEASKQVTHDKKTTFLGHLTMAEHPQGLLGRRCPVCFYAYGTSWLYEPIPLQDMEAIHHLIQQGEPL